MRVIAGTAKGVPLTAPRGGTRPTTDRVREAVFSLLAGWAGAGGSPAETQLGGLSLLDLYAGSGAVAVEAASRGAGPVTAVDTAKAACLAAQANQRAAGVAVTVVRSGAEPFLQGRPPTAFDIVWLDPPYDLDEAALARVLALVAGGWLAGGGLVAVERSSRGPAPAWPHGLSQRPSRRYGETVVHFAIKEAA